MAPLSRTRSSSHPIKRNISGPLVLGSAAARERREKQRQWTVRAGTVIGFVVLIPTVVYLGMMVFTLQQKLKDAKVQQKHLKSQLLTATHRSVRRHVGKILPSPSATNQVASREKQTLLLKTGLGELRIVLRPDLSKESVEYIQQTAKSACEQCHFYRADKPGVLQGIVKQKTAADSPTDIPRGPCPIEYEHVINDCRPEDAECGCHGPIMTRGAVGWAAGRTGPDFFINDYPKPATWWGTTHTVFGEIQDHASFAVIEEIWKLKTHKIDVGFNHLDDLLLFEIEIEEERLQTVDTGTNQVL